METERDSSWYEGMRIKELVGNGIEYLGRCTTDGTLGHLFVDNKYIPDASFVADTLEEAKERLIQVRESFGAPPPVFASS